MAGNEDITKPTIAEAAIEDKTCSSCHWLRTLYRGKCCADNGILESSKACSSFQERIIKADIIKEDIVIKAINEEVRNNLYPKFDRSLIDELQQYFVFSIKMTDKEERPVPTYFNAANEWEILQQINEQCQAYRDRVLAIQFSFVKIKQDLDRLWRQAEAYIINNYSSFLSSLKDVNQRNTVIGDILEDLTDLYEEIKNLSTKCEQVTINLNSASFALKEIREIATKVYDIRTGNKRTV